MKPRYQNFCPLIDDVPDEAAAISKQLRDQGFPFVIRPVVPARTTTETYERIKRAYPSAAIIDYCLLDRPRINVEILGARLVRQNIPTVFVTKDRNVVDEGPRVVGDLNIPVFLKQQLIVDRNYFGQCIRQLGWRAQGQPHPDVNFRERLAELQDRKLLRALTRSERDELRVLMARAELEEEEEADRIKKSESGLRAEVEDIAKLIRQVTDDLKKT
jgi:hypothetical protein